MTHNEIIWQRICSAAGQDFATVRGVRFRYKIEGNAIVPYGSTRTTRYPLHRSQVDVALSVWPVSGPAGLHMVRGPSYLYAILSDPRIAA